jgi:hypothetical protein
LKRPIGLKWNYPKWGKLRTISGMKFPFIFHLRNCAKWKPNSLGVIINQYKRICTIHARQIHAGFGWQSRFHDHIIRDDASFKRISEYIVNNPAKWTGDKFFKQ